MRIFITELAGEERLTTREFDQPTIKFGRDPSQCDVVFEQGKWLMVSRLHAQLQTQNGRWYLSDLQSRQGTLLNGQLIGQPTEVTHGTRIQFGQAGPVVVLETTQTGAKAPQRQPDYKPAASLPPPTAAPQPAVPILVLKSGIPARGQHTFSLSTERTVLGRDPEVDVQVEAEAQVVSRRHAAIRKQGDGSFVIMDLQSFNGTLVNNQRITQPTPLHHGDIIQLATNGPVLQFVDPRQTSPTPGVPLSTPAEPAQTKLADSIPDAATFDMLSRTIVSRPALVEHAWAVPDDKSHAQLLFQKSFNQDGRLSVGRAADNDIQLDALLISNHHARFLNTAEGVVVQDAGSTNGVYLNGERVIGWQPVKAQDVVHIGPFLLNADPRTGVAVFDRRSKTRVDAIGITDVLRRSGHSLRLLDNISIAIEPNEFVGLLGPSGAGKSLLMNALNGMRRTSSGRVFVNNLDLYQHLQSLKQGIGHVPQDDIIHRELTIYRTLYYVARLRLSRDVATQEIDQIINEVLEVTGLSERRDTPVAQLSGGQRKRVSIAVELITKPSIIFLDEPTSGLDPATEERIMKLFRQIAESGRTVVLTTHAMENVHLFDKIALLMRGKLIFYGTPKEALAFVGAGNFIDVYNKLDQPFESVSAELPPLPADSTPVQRQQYEIKRNEIAEAAAEEWRRRFLETEAYGKLIAEPLSQINQASETRAVARRRPGLIDSMRQWATLVRRYSQVLLSDKINLLILLGQAPIIALLTYLVVSKDDPRDFAYFVLALVPIWFGTSVAAREIVKERSIYKRERMVNLGLLPYVGSKLFPLLFIVAFQCLMLFGTLKSFDLLGLMDLPGFFGGAGQLAIMILTGVVGIALGLFVSALVRTSETATSIVPLLLIPQILLCGLVGVPRGAARVVGAVMPATWSFDEMKRLSTLDTLRQEGSSVSGPNHGRGLIKRTEEANDENIARTRAQIADQQAQSEKDLRDYERKLKEYLSKTAAGRGAPGNPPAVPTLRPTPEVPEVQKINDDLSDYVSFKHPWGNVVLDFLILVVMFLGLTLATIISLRVKDLG